MAIRLLDGCTCVFDLRSPISGFGESCTIVHGITPESGKRLVKRAPLTAVSSISNRLVTTWKGDFSTPHLWVLGGHGVKGIGPFGSPPVCARTQIWYMITNTTLKAFASSSGQINYFVHKTKYFYVSIGLNCKQSPYLLTFSSLTTGCIYDL